MERMSPTEPNQSRKNRAPTQPQSSPEAQTFQVDVMFLGPGEFEAPMLTILIAL